MPPAPIVVGTEYEWHSGGSVALFFTVFDATGLPYEIRGVQTGTDVLTLIVNRGVLGPLERTVRLDVGSDVLVSQAQSVALGYPFDVVRRRVQVSIVPTPQGFRGQGRGPR